MGQTYAEENYKIAKAREQIKFGNDFERKILDVFSKISTSNLETETSTNIQRALQNMSTLTSNRELTGANVLVSAQRANEAKDDIDRFLNSYSNVMNKLAPLVSFSRQYSKRKNLPETVIALTSRIDKTYKELQSTYKQVNSAVRSNAAFSSITYGGKRFKTEDEEIIKKPANVLPGAISYLIGNLNELVGFAAAKERLEQELRGMAKGVKVTVNATGTQSQLTFGNQVQRVIPELENLKNISLDLVGNKADSQITITKGKDSYTINISSKAWSSQSEGEWMQSYGSMTQSFEQILLAENQSLQEAILNDIVFSRAEKSDQSTSTSLQYLARKYMFNFVGKDIDFIQYSDGFVLMSNFLQQVMNTNFYHLALTYQQGALDNELIAPNAEGKAALMYAAQRSNAIVKALLESKVRLIK